MKVLLTWKTHSSIHLFDNYTPTHFFNILTKLIKIGKGNEQVSMFVYGSSCPKEMVVEGGKELVGEETRCLEMCSWEMRLLEKKIALERCIHRRILCRRYWFEKAFVEAFIGWRENQLQHSAARKPMQKLVVMEKNLRKQII